MEVKLFAPLNGGKAGRTNQCNIPTSLNVINLLSQEVLCSALLVEEGKKRVTWGRDSCRSGKDTLNKPSLH